MGIRMQEMKIINEDVIGVRRRRPVARWTLRVTKVLGIVVIGAAVLAAIAHVVWTMTGSNKWELAIDRNDIKVYTLKVPGSSLLQFKGSVRVATTLNRAVSAMLDNSIENCADWISSCAVSKILDPLNDRDLSFTGFWLYNYPAPFAPREYLLKGTFSKNAKTGALTLQYEEMPSRLPLNDCCVRISHMRNRWIYTPLPNGQINAELTEDVNMGIPYPMYNRMGAEDVYGALNDLDRLLNKKAYFDKNWSFVDNSPPSQ